MKPIPAIAFCLLLLPLTLLAGRPAQGPAQPRRPATGAIATPPAATNAVVHNPNYPPPPPAPPAPIAPPSTKVKAKPKKAKP